MRGPATGSISVGPLCGHSCSGGVVKSPLLSRPGQPHPSHITIRLQPGALRRDAQCQPGRPPPQATGPCQCHARASGLHARGSLPSRLTQLSTRCWSLWERTAGLGKAAWVAGIPPTASAGAKLCGIEIDRQKATQWTERCQCGRRARRTTSLG